MSNGLCTYAIMFLTLNEQYEQFQSKMTLDKFQSSYSYERILIYGPRQKIVYKKCFHGNHCLSPNTVTTPPSNCMQSFQNQSFRDSIYIYMNVSTEHKHVVTMVFWWKFLLW